MSRTFVIFAVLILWLPQANASVAVSSARIWPAQDYTRLTIESRKPIKYNMFTINNPDRLVIDLNNVVLGKTLNSLPKLVGNDDPYISSVRVGKFKPGIVRLVLDLKTEVKPQIFNLKPVSEYGYRVVLDVYPVHPIDPLMALLESQKIKSIEPTSSPPGTEHEAEIKVRPSSDQPSRSNVTELRSRTLIIAIDAGHGGEDPGARGKHGSREKNITLAIARKVKALMNETPNMRGILIRDGDYFIPLGRRVQKAHDLHADLFISIHADSFVKSRARGSSVFALSEHGATSSAARWLAKKENEADLIGGVSLAEKEPYLARTLLDLSQTQTLSDSLTLAKHVLNELGDVNTLHRGRVEQAGFAVLKSPKMPSILIETAFISNPKEERRLNDKNYQNKLANAILSGIKRYFAQNPALSKPNIAHIN